MRISDWSSDVCSSDLLERTDFGPIMLRRRNLHRAVMRFCGLSCSDLREADFRHSELTGCDLSAPDLSTPNFASVHLRGAALTRAMLPHTRFNKAQPAPSRLPGAAARDTRNSDPPSPAHPDHSA